MSSPQDIVFLYGEHALAFFCGLILISEATSIENLEMVHLLRSIRSEEDLALVVEKVADAVQADKNICVT